MPSVEYCQAPSVPAFAVLPDTAMPVMVAAPLSGSVKWPANRLATVAPGGFAVSSATAASVAGVTTGASFTAVTWIVAVAVLLGSVPSLTTTVTVRSVVSGLSLELLNTTCCSAA